MRKIVFLFLLTGLLTGCEYTSYQVLSYNVNEPVFITREEFRNSVKVTSQPQELKTYGKIGSYEAYLYISEPNEGIHIINNANPSNPQNIGFIRLMGNRDLIIRNQFLYADSYTDLVWFDLSNPSLPVLKGRVENIFPDAFPVIDNEYDYDYSLCIEGIENDQVVVGWLFTERIDEIPYGADSSESHPSLIAKSGEGLESMSRFALHDTYLYAVINNQMSIIDLSTGTPRKVEGNIYISNHVETVFSYQDKMFIGTSFGLLIYSLQEPLNPVLCSQVMHIYDCNPIAMNDTLAYVTIRVGNQCGQKSNELIVLDMSDAYQPAQIASYPMYNPKGMLVNKDVLFVCDDGLKIFNLSNPNALNSQLITHYNEIDGYDIVSSNNVVIVISDNGLHQYDCSNLSHLNLLSVIPFRPS
ncbi:MAG: hypothetical protein FWF52_11245 [Candidatus Azobacteroides sp.]|nr:hypothetical protein [Candidatus Azobacteroides sp.]